MKDNIIAKIIKVKKQIENKKEDIQLFSDNRQYAYLNISNLLFVLKIELNFLERKLEKYEKKLHKNFKNKDITKEVEEYIKNFKEKINDLKVYVLITQNNMKKNFEDPNYNLAADEKYLRKINKKLAKLEENLKISEQLLSEVTTEKLETVNEKA